MMNQQQDRSEAKIVVRAGETRGHPCEECNKIFSSGKALGGHVSSAHIQPANKDYYSFKTKLKSKIEDSGSGSGPHACGVCAKRFPSQKSLYGHMRCHPDREWRGMEPPPRRRSNELSLSSESDNSDDDPGSDYSGLDQDRDEGSGPDDTNPPLDFGWHVKGKRGRLARPGPDSGWGPEDPAVSAGRQLLRILKRMPDSVEKGIVAPVGLQGPEPVDSFGLQDHMLARQGPAKANIDHFHPNVEEADHEVHARDRKRPRANNPAPEKGTFESEADLFFGAVSVLANGKREMTRSYVHNQEKLSPARKVEHSGLSSKFACITCKKGFHSHQALGGHMSSHNKAKKIDSSSNGVVRIDKADQPHLCSVCEKNFPTGQALGGHKKCHKNSSGDGSGKDGGHEKKDVIVRDFDLNMEPDEDAWS